MQVLVVEPDRRLGQVYAAALRGRGHEVDVASTAQDAVVCADKHTPDLVLLELQLTAHGGIEFLYEFRSYVDWTAVPVIIISNVPPAEFAGSQKLLRERLGVGAYHYKPRTSLQVLLHAVENCLAAPADKADA
jgi:DNA-binding response OmpR family regulator